MLREVSQASESREAAGVISPEERRRSTSWLLYRQILKKIGVISSAVGVCLARLPELAAYVQVAISIHVGHDRFMPAQVVVEDHPLDKIGALAVHVLPDEPARRGTPPMCSISTVKISRSPSPSKSATASE